MSFFKVHLSRSADGLFAGVLCGALLSNPQAVTLSTEEQSPLDSPRLCNKCRDLANTDQHRGRFFEFGYAEAQQVMDGE